MKFMSTNFVAAVVLVGSLAGTVAATRAAAQDTGYAVSAGVTPYGPALAQRGRIPQGCHYRQVCVKWIQNTKRPPMHGAVVGAIIGDMGGPPRSCAQWRSQIVCER